ncbi:MAG: DUF937 domain-containing protein [Rhodothermales bacterium]
MAGLLDLLNQQLGEPVVQQVSTRIGADPASTQKAMATALPLLVGGLARNANQSPSGAQSLANALDRDHDGSLLDGLSGLLGGGGGGGALGGLLGGSGGGALGGLLGGSGSASGGGGLLGMAGDLLGGAASSRTTNGDGILRHVLGERRSAVEQGVARSSGLDAGQVSKLLPLLAPIVMGALGKVKQQQNLDAGGLAGLLNQERTRVEHDTPGMTEGGLARFLDMDGDGDISDDVAKIGSAIGSSGLLGKLFG